MLSLDGGILQNLPNVLHHKQRISLGTIGFAIDSILLKYEVIIQKLNSYSREDLLQGRFKWGDTVILFSDLWAIVDQTHVLNQLLQQEIGDSAKRTGLPKERTTPEIKSYLDSYAIPISTLRNKMDHLRGNLNNLSNAKGAIYPIHGSLSYILANPEEVAQGIVHVVNLCGGIMTHSNHTMPMINPLNYSGQQLNCPVDLLQLSAFDTLIDISKLYKDTKSFKEALDLKLKAQIEQQLKNYAQQNNLDYNELLKDIASPFPITVFDVNIEID